MNVLVKRFEKFGLRLHPEKTKLLEFEGYITWEKMKQILKKVPLATAKTRSGKVRNLESNPAVRGVYLKNRMS